jgi:hypothetical protein
MLPSGGLGEYTGQMDGSDTASGVADLARGLLPENMIHLSATSSTAAVTSDGQRVDDLGSGPRRCFRC